MALSYHSWLEMIAVLFFLLFICAQCIYEDKGCLCDACARSHECGEEMLLPLVNSPRAGVCGYTGQNPAYSW